MEGDKVSAPGIDRDARRVYLDWPTIGALLTRLEYGLDGDDDDDGNGSAAEVESVVDAAWFDEDAIPKDASVLVSAISALVFVLTELNPTRDEFDQAVSRATSWVRSNCATSEINARLRATGLVNIPD